VGSVVWRAFPSPTGAASRLPVPSSCSVFGGGSIAFACRVWPGKRDPWGVPWLVPWAIRHKSCLKLPPTNKPRNLDSLSPQGQTAKRCGQNVIGDARLRATTWSLPGGPLEKLSCMGGALGVPLESARQSSNWSDEFVMKLTEPPSTATWGVLGRVVEV